MTAGAMTAMTAGDRQKGRTVVRSVLSLLMLVAAGLKAYEVATGPPEGDRFFDSRLFLIGLVQLEILFGLILLTGLYLRQAWFTGMILFSVFAAVSLGKGLAGAESCGCFGRVHVHPWWTFTLDVAVLVAMWRGRSAWRAGTPVACGGPRWIIVAGTLLLVGGPTAYWMATTEPAWLTGDGVIVGDGRLVILEPEKWVGKPLPVQRHIDVGHLLNEGSWVLLFHHHDCPKCQEAIPHYQDLDYEDLASPRPTGAPRIALIEIPPYGPLSHSSSSDHLVYGRLSNAREWFVQTPVEIVLQRGKVSQVTTGRDFWRSPRDGRSLTGSFQETLIRARGNNQGQKE